MPNTFITSRWVDINTDSIVPSALDIDLTDLEEGIQTRVGDILSTEVLLSTPEQFQEIYWKLRSWDKIRCTRWIMSNAYIDLIVVRREQHWKNNIKLTNIESWNVYYIDVTSIRWDGSMHALQSDGRTPILFGRIHTYQSVPRIQTIGGQTYYWNNFKEPRAAWFSKVDTEK